MTRYTVTFRARQAGALGIFDQRIPYTVEAEDRFDALQRARALLESERDDVETFGADIQEAPAGVPHFPEA